ncbi:MAG: hypothetical protein ACFBSE_06550 [Prochloraceae cyanobacterium]
MLTVRFPPAPFPSVWVDKPDGEPSIAFKPSRLIFCAFTVKFPPLPSPKVKRSEERRVVIDI